MSKLPVTIISPVMNCVRDMPAHTEHLRLLSGMVRETIIVDSRSGDGTMEYLQKALGDLDIRYLDHPPGLYQCWNHAISKATQPYLIMATVGDILPPESLVRLHETIRKFDADAVVSAPTLVNSDGRPSNRKWAVHQFLGRLRRDSPIEMDASSWITMNYGVYSAALIASSASNIYRTSFLRGNPFPTDFGHWGDNALAMTTGHCAKWVIDPGVKSRFLLHPPSKDRINTHSDAFERKRAALASGYLERHGQMLVDSGVPPHVMEALGQAVVQIQKKNEIRSSYNRRPVRSLPWFLNPHAIKLRRERRRVEAQMMKRRELVLEFVANRLNATPPAA
jgi:glycosyltransferase involved in cell wall biosynthesis